MRIRCALPADAAALLELRERLASETSMMLLEPGEFRDSVDDMSRQIERLNGHSNGLLLLAEFDGELVGQLSVLGGATRRTRHRASLALGVARSHWGRGVATALLEHALAWSREAGLQRLELTVHTTNLRAIGVYLRCGFGFEGVRRSSLQVDGRAVDEYSMALIHEG